MLTDYASVGEQELWNTLRLATYLTNVGSPFDTGPEICHCDSLTPGMLGDFPYTTPDDVANPAPWYDADYPKSAEFLGFMPLSVDGIDNNPLRREVTNAVGGGGVFGPSRATPREIVVTGVLIGTSCCGVEYGLHYMSETLATGCMGDSCNGGCLQMYSCCPDEGMTPVQFQAAYRRNFLRTALVSGPDIVRRNGTASCGNGGCQGGDLIEIEFILTAGNPWPWTDPAPRLEVTLPEVDDDCVEWCVTDGVGDDCGGEPCLFKDCVDDVACMDPLSSFIRPPEPTVPSSSFCVPIAPETACYTIDLTDRPKWSQDVPVIELFSSTAELRNVQISFYEKSDPLADCATVAGDETCSPVLSYYVRYMPQMSFLTIDGRSVKATIDCGSGCQPYGDVYGDDDGGPIQSGSFDCAMYCVCISVDSQFPPSSGARVDITTSGRGL